MLKSCSKYNIFPFHMHSESNPSLPMFVQPVIYRLYSIVYSINHSVRPIAVLWSNHESKTALGVLCAGSLPTGRAVR
jgi:hypothetical protein